MNAPLTAVVVFVVTLGGALLGLALGRVLPAHHLTEQTKDVIKVSTAVVATLAALVAGLLTAAAKSSLDARVTILNRTATLTILLDHTLADYGGETEEARHTLRRILERAIAAVWDENGESVNLDTVDRRPGMLPVQRLLLPLGADDDTHKWLKSRAPQLVGEIDDLRWQMIQQRAGSIRWQVVAILTSWFVIIFFSFGLFSPRNAVVYVVLTVSAPCVATALYLVVQMDRPYRGFMQLSSAPLRAAVAEIGH